MLKKISHITFMVAFGLMSLFLFVPEPVASGPQRDRICFYEDTDFRGQSTCLYAGESISNLKSRGWNDKISSIRIYGQARVVLYQNTGFRGESINLTQDISNLKALGWNDKISSIQVTSDYADGGYGRRDHRRRDNRRDDRWDDPRDEWRRQGQRLPAAWADDGICVYEDTNFRGRSRCFRVGEYVDRLTQVDGGFWNDRISSIRIIGRGGVTVYGDSEFRGNSRTINTDVPDLKRLGINDQISSLEVFGGGRY